MEEAAVIADPEYKGPPTQEELVIKLGPKQGVSKGGDYVFGKDEIRKDINTEVITGDKAYVAAGHGTVLLNEKISKDGPQEKLEYYDKGFVGQQKEKFGDDRAKNYDAEREVDMLGRKRAADYQQIKIDKPDIGPRKQLKEKDPKKKTKIIESMGSEKYPERNALPSGKNKHNIETKPVNLTCVHCKARITTKVDKRIDPMKFILLCLPVVTLILLPKCDWAYVHSHNCPDCGSLVGGSA